MSKPVTLNVGGRLYSTSLTTLTRYPESMLGSMFSGAMPTSSDSQGNYFIDRDGEMFRYILNFLRNSHLDLPVDFQELDLLKREADFFQIQPLLELLQTADPKISRIKNVTLNIIHDSKAVHSCPANIVTARLFCTSVALLRLLSSKFYYRFEWQVLPVCKNPEDLSFLSVEWAETRTGATANDKRLVRETCKPLYVLFSHQQICSLEMLVSHVIKIAVSEGGFFIHSFSPVSSGPVILQFHAQ
ncbi:BTB/POZ domain-containing protein KCTD21-like [Callorhinchus milii]|uniref:BTB/POZ domain-containing protein KCTD21-like n=1 Tax=Callorhinchus milii TaxID=7868 RepID=UPI001C3F8550|nr:BTB/POZ domain-containing protein KCTD21-like [Callorhinchus milii]